ncbi:SMI1/KNR4 family protein [Actinoplanes regularis]|uniref:Cell wall assembly regulator SMI1 n=1 Tax=Actinoplanes regularis TaxID=52697 RepID=A0A239FE05_9ACTN|nr:SMI1/KNR4 family protein [Actinoplanes regularis]GIE89550.1 SMI1/KNR4 family protein [Actinoplanes regularis]SNS54981.1 Cell wall assembly regulator SMI1 [Actinoplanes regularis]
MPSIYDVTTWELLVQLMRAGNGADGPVNGHVSPAGWSVPGPHRDWNIEHAAVERVLGALTEDDLEDISFVLDGSALHLIETGPAVDGLGTSVGSLLLVEGAIAEPWRRLPAPAPGTAASPSADPALLERHLRERLPTVRGATEEEIAAAEARLGVALPEELKVLYRVVRAGREDPLDGLFEALGFDLLGPDVVFVADAASRPCPWEFAAKDAVITYPDALVQGVVGSPGWIAFAGNGGGDQYAIDLTPGPRGYQGQVILINHEESVGAAPIAESLTDLMVRERHYDYAGPTGDQTPVIAYARDGNLLVHPELEVLSLGSSKAGQFRLAPLSGLPRLRTLAADPGSLADPREVALLTGLEYLELDLDDWRVLLDADAVPKGLSAAGVRARNQDLLAVADLSNELLARWNRPLITRTTLSVRS